MTEIKISQNPSLMPEVRGRGGEEEKRQVKERALCVFLWPWAQGTLGMEQVAIRWEGFY